MISLATKMVTLQWERPILQAQQLLSQFSPAKKSIRFGANILWLEDDKKKKNTDKKKPGLFVRDIFMLELFLFMLILTNIYFTYLEDEAL